MTNGRSDFGNQSSRASEQCNYKPNRFNAKQEGDIGETMTNSCGTDPEAIALTQCAVPDRQLVDVTVLDAISPDDFSRLAPELPGLSSDDSERVHKYTLRASATNTLRAYKSDWRLFVAWCAERGYTALPASPETTAAYLTDLAENGSSHTRGRKLAKSTIGRKLAAIVFAHRVAEYDPPTQQSGSARLERAWSGIRTDANGRNPIQKRAATQPILSAMIGAIEGNDARALRDRALLAIGMTGALRRSELVSIQREHIEFLPDGISIAIGRSKTDQTGKGATIHIPRGDVLSAVSHLERWLEAAAISSGPVFLKMTPQGRVGTKAMSAHGAAHVIKAAAGAAGYDPSRFSGHSLRAGFLTEAANQGEDLFSMKAQSRHKSTEVLVGYVRRREGFKNSAARKFS